LNVLALLPLAALAIPIIPALIEIFRRKDKGPRQIPEQTLYEDRTIVSDRIPVLEQMRARARVKATGDIIRVVGDVSIPNGAEIKENIVAHGNLRLGSKCHILGSMKAFGKIEVGEESFVEGHIISEGKVTIGRNARVNGIVDSAENIILRENALVEAVSTEKSVMLAPKAKINRRISAGVSITATPPSPTVVPTEGPRIPRGEEESEISEAVKRTMPDLNIFFEERLEKVTDEKSRLFQSLQDRMRSLESSKARVIDETGLKDLTPSEIEIYKLAISGWDVNKIGLRLLLDPVQVQEVISSLVKRHYLDEEFRPSTPEKAEESGKVIGETAATTQKLEKKRGQSELAGVSVNEAFEKLFASKLRTEARKRLKSAKGESPADATETDGKSAEDGEAEEILEEWREASSLVYGCEETRRENPSDGANNLAQKDEDDVKFPDYAGKGSREKDTQGLPRSVHRKHLRGFLSLLTLSFILLSEITYYNSSLFTFLDQILPLNLRTWMIFLSLAVILIFSSSIRILRHVARQTGLTLLEETQGD